MSGKIIRWAIAGAVVTAVAIPGIQAIAQNSDECDLAYAGVCIPPPPPDLDCGEITQRRFRVYLPTDNDLPDGLTRFDPHRFDGDDDGIGCES